MDEYDPLIQPLGAVPTRRKLESPDPRPRATFGVLLDVTPQRLRFCRDRYAERDEAEFSFNGTYARETATGREFVVVTTADPWCSTTRELPAGCSVVARSCSCATRTSPGRSRLSTSAPWARDEQRAEVRPSLGLDRRTRSRPTRIPVCVQAETSSFRRAPSYRRRPRASTR